MKTSDIFKNHKEEIVNKTIGLLPNALRGDKVNRTFFVKVDGNGLISVDYFVYLGNTSLTDNCYYTIPENENIDLDEYGVNDLNELDFNALGWDDYIENAISEHIEELEMNDL